MVGGGLAVWADVTLLSPGWLLLLPLTIFMAHRWGDRVQAFFAPMPSIQVRHPLADRLHSVSVCRTGPPLHVRIVVGFSLSLMLFAMAQPVRLGASLNDETLPVDLVIMVDTSVTMTLKDYVVEGQAVDRFTIARIILERFLTEFEGRSVAIVVLGQPSAIWLPLTAELDLARHLVGRLRLSLGGRHAALGDALVEVAEQFSDEHVHMTGRMVLLLTDGVLPSGSVSPIEGGRRLAQSGMKLMALGIGAMIDPAADPVADQQVMRLIYEPLDMQLLKDIVQPSEGVAHHAATVEQAVAALHTQIRKMGAEVVHVANTNRQQIPLYPWLLIPALLLLLGLPLFAMRSRTTGEYG